VVRPPTPWRGYLSSLSNPQERTNLLRILSLFVVLSVFWALFDQTGSSWVLQAEKMDRSIVLPFAFRWELLASQVQALNPILILVLVPLCTWGIYPVLSRNGLLSVRGKVLTGLVLSATSILWQVLAYGVLTAAEVAISITTLELAYTSAPAMSRSLVTSFYLLSVSLGNIITAVVSGPMAPLVGGPESPVFFSVFSGLSLVACVPAWLILGRMRTIVPT
jgi:POT family proton-dependent oligopeptide transporter